jgi:hypothetical protein
MVKTLILGLKNVIFVILNNENNKIQKVQHDHKIYIKLFRNGLECFPILKDSIENSNEEKENLESFASLFTVLPMPTFQEIFTQQLPHLYEKFLESQNYLAIPNHFLGHASCSNYFSEILIKFLLKKME